ncbi:MAG: preprotein translocase subunit YajC [Gammaproteobacteria bacterium]|nr:preprotein translocase subunit YajC [Gammaproteobacteria bacterium]
MNLIESVAYAGAGGGGTGGGWLTIAMLVGMVALFYFLLIRPQQKQRKAHQELVGALSPGDEVIMASGMMGIIKKVEDDYVIVRVSKSVELRFQKGAVNASLPKGTLEL